MSGVNFEHPFKKGDVVINGKGKWQSYGAASSLITETIKQEFDRICPGDCLKEIRLNYNKAGSRHYLEFFNYVNKDPTVRFRLVALHHFKDNTSIEYDVGK